VVLARLNDVRRRITAAGGDPERVAVVAVTKGQPMTAVLSALAIGALDLGENYAGELLDKAAALESRVREPWEGEPAGPPRWHFLGAVQRNKVRRLAPVVACWQGVSRGEEAVAIARSSEQAEIFVEINTTGEAGRGGCSPVEAGRVVETALQAGCRVRGLMTVAPLVAGVSAPETAAEGFATVAGLAATLGLGELSMGMSHDLEQAVAAGSTMIRIGTALFGERSGDDPRKLRRGLQQ
jgi:hypothetical protein